MNSLLELDRVLEHRDDLVDRLVYLHKDLMRQMKWESEARINRMSLEKIPRSKETTELFEYLTSEIVKIDTELRSMGVCIWEQPFDPGSFL